MSSAARVSAFAKRRRLNDGNATPVADSIEPVTKPTSQVSSRKVKISTRSVKKDTHDRNIEQHESEDDLTTPSENMFEPLVEAKIVTFSGIREIEQVNDKAFKIRLSKGQRCVIRGIARLWVRQGSVSVYGASLHESSQMHTVFASFADGPPEVSAQSKMAEFQLESIPPSDPTFPSALNVPGKLGREARSSQLSFRVHQGNDESIEGSANDQTNVLIEQVRRISLGTTNPFKASPHPIEDQNLQRRRGTQPRIMVSGKRSSATSKVCVALINRVLTESFSGQDNGQVAFLDLDHFSPTFACPGTASLALIQAPILGPSYASPLRVGSHAINRLVRSYFLGNCDDFSTVPYGSSLVEKLLSKDLDDVPLIIRIGPDFSALSNQQIIDFTRITAPSLHVCITSSKSSALYEAVKTIAEKSSSVLSRLLLPATASISATDAHRMSLQSHFRLFDVLGSEPQWFPKMSSQVLSRSLSLPISRNAQHLSFLAIHGGVLRNEDITEALQNALVTIVASHSKKCAEPFAALSTTNNASISQAMNGPTSSFAIRLRHYEDVVTPFQHVGLAYVDSLDEAANSITLTTSVDETQVQRYLEGGCELGLVLERPSADGRFAPQLLLK